MSIQDSNIHTRTEIPDVLAASGYQEMLNQREEKTGAWLSGHGTYDIGKWSDFFPVCGKIVVKRKITANLAVIFLKNGGPDRIRTDDPYNANVVRSQLRYKPMLYSETSLAQNSRKWKGKLKKREKTFAISVLVLN